MNQQNKSTMKAETLKALQGSIQKWQDIVDGTGVDNGRMNCPLCALRKSEDCGECPVNKYCRDTPFEEWSSHQKNIHSSRYPYKVVPDCPGCKRLAKAEVEYLKSLLPVEKEKMTMRKIEIYQEKEGAVEEEPIRLKLERGSLNTIIVVAVKENGEMAEGGNLVNISPSGIRPIGGVGEDIGFDLNEKRQLKILDD